MSILGDLGTAIKNKLALKANIASPTFTGVVTAPTFSGSLSGDATTAGGLAVATGTNNVANQIVRTDASGYIQCGYIQSSGGNEHNLSSPSYVWGTNGSDNYMRTYNTGYLSVNYANSSGSCSGNAATATTAANATKLNGQNWYWSGQSGQPSWLWGGSDGTNMYVYNPSNFSVNYANSSGSCSGNAATVSTITSAQVRTATAGINAGDIGSYMLCVGGLNTTAKNGTIAGSYLKGGGIRATSIENDSVALTGTWKCMGYAPNANTAATLTLWLRIA